MGHWLPPMTRVGDASGRYGGGALGARAAPLPSFLDQIEARRAEKILLLLSSSFLWKFVADCVCRFDFLKITNENNEVPGLHCGQKNGYEVLVTGEVVLMTFHSDVHYEREGFLLQFTPIPHGEL